MQSALRKQVQATLGAFTPVASVRWRLRGLLHVLSSLYKRRTFSRHAIIVVLPTILDKLQPGPRHRSYSPHVCPYIPERQHGYFASTLHSCTIEPSTTAYYGAVEPNERGASPRHGGFPVE